MAKFNINSVSTPSLHFDKKKEQNFKFEKNGIFAGYFVKPSFEKVNGNLQVKKDKDGKEIILGIRMKYEQKAVLAILKEMHLELIAKKKKADAVRLEMLKEKQETEKAEAEAAEAEAEEKAIK